jgi:hypothetical protein
VIDVLSDLGIQRDRIVVEDASATTYENARNTAPMLVPKRGERWILVTRPPPISRGPSQRSGRPVSMSMPSPPTTAKGYR